MSSAGSRLCTCVAVLAAALATSKALAGVDSIGEGASITVTLGPDNKSRRRFQRSSAAHLRNSMNPIYDIDLETIDGAPQKLADFAGKAMLIVNVASKCGFTPQYEGLEALYRRYRERGLVVLGFPCDQFGHQEPGAEAEIKQFCTAEYDVTFPMFAKTKVNGDDAHPLFAALKAAAKGVLGTQAIKWNFTKFLVDRSGKVVRRYAPTDKPGGLARDIEALLG
jgi:glutathione peroxidase